MINQKLLKYTDDKKYLIYKKDLRYKRGDMHTYYFIVENNQIIDIILHRMADDFVDKARLSTKNVELEVYKAVKYEGSKYYSFRIKERIEYVLDKLIEADSKIGLFFCKNKTDLQYHFFNEDNRVVLKAKIKIDDIIGCNGRDIQLKRVIPMSIEKRTNQR